MLSSSFQRADIEVSTEVAIPKILGSTREALLLTKKLQCLPHVCELSEGMRENEVDAVQGKTSQTDLSADEVSDRGESSAKQTYVKLIRKNNEDKGESGVFTYASRSSNNAPNIFSIRIHHGGKFQRYPGRIYVNGRVDIFDMVDIDLFTVVALNMMVLKLGYTGKSKPMFYNYLRPLTSLVEGLYALACEEDVRCLATLVRSFKLIEVYIEHGVTALDSYLRAPRETTKEPICDSVTSSSLPQHDSSTPCKDSICESITPRCMPDCILTSPTDESVIDDVMRQLSFDETELDGEASFANFARSSVDSSWLSHDESFGIDDLDLNLNEHVNLNVSQVETQSELLVSEEPDVGRTQEPILAEVPIIEEVRTQEFSVEDVVLEDYVSSGEDVEQYNGEFDESAPSDGQFFFDDEGIDTEYDVQSSEDAGTDDDDDDIDEDFLVDEESEIVKPDVDVHLFGISMDLSFDNIGVTNLMSDDVLEGEDVDVINADGFDSDPGKDEETNYRKRSQASSSVLDAHDKGDLCPWVLEIKHYTYKFLSEKIFEQVRVNLDILVKAVQDQLQRELEVQISMSKAFRAKAKAEEEIRGDHIL
ncbi:hypothetical protein Tco_0892289 [Tanacetum coccineum]|uniref:PB1-like domain-containing protein n=1 Tax=Tanacetum coccineum TaxID=301880 RepID=A0ABQ5C8A9_9ASTR